MADEKRFPIENGVEDAKHRIEAVGKVDGVEMKPGTHADAESNADADGASKPSVDAGRSDADVKVKSEVKSVRAYRRKSDVASKDASASDAVGKGHVEVGNSKKPKSKSKNPVHMDGTFKIRRGPDEDVPYIRYNGRVTVLDVSDPWMKVEYMRYSKGNIVGYIKRDESKK